MSWSRNSGRGAVSTTPLTFMTVSRCRYGVPPTGLNHDCQPGGTKPSSAAFSRVGAVVAGRVGVLVEVLAQQGAAVAVWLEPRGQRRGLTALVPAEEAAGRVVVAAHAVVVGVLPGQDARPRRAAGRLLDVVAVERRALVADSRRVCGIHRISFLSRSSATTISTTLGFGRPGRWCPRDPGRRAVRRPPSNGRRPGGRRRPPQPTTAERPATPGHVRSHLPLLVAVDHAVGETRTRRSEGLRVPILCPRGDLNPHAR